MLTQRQIKTKINNLEEIILAEKNALIEHYHYFQSTESKITSGLLLIFAIFLGSKIKKVRFPFHSLVKKIFRAYLTPTNLFTIFSIYKPSAKMHLFERQK